MKQDVGLDLHAGVTDERALRALVGLSVCEQVFGQVVLAHEALVAVRTRKVPGAVGRLVLPQGAVLAEPLLAKGAGVRGLLRVGPVMRDQLGFVAQNPRTLATRPRTREKVGVIGETLRVVKLFGANPTFCLRLRRRRDVV